MPKTSTDTGSREKLALATLPVYLLFAIIDTFVCLRVCGDSAAELVRQPDVRFADYPHGDKLAPLAQT